MISLNQDMPVIPGRAGVSERRPKFDPQYMNVEEWTFEPGTIPRKDQPAGHVHSDH